MGTTQIHSRDVQREQRLRQILNSEAMVGGPSARLSDENGVPSVGGGTVCVLVN